MRQRIRSVLEWAVAMEMRMDNPCDCVLPVLGPQNDIVQHMQALAHQDVAAAVETVRKSGSAAPAIKLALEFLVLTAARSGEVRLASGPPQRPTSPRPSPRIIRYMPRGRLWTPAEDRLVRATAEQNRQHGIAGSGKHENRLRAVAERIGRTCSAVRSRAIRLRAASYRTL